MPKKEVSNFREDPTVALPKYKALLDAGVITAEEFEAKKKQLLDCKNARRQLCKDCVKSEYIFKLTSTWLSDIL